MPPATEHDPGFAADLDAVVERTGVARYRDLTDPGHPAFDPRFVDFVRAEAARPSRPASGPRTRPAAEDDGPDPFAGFDAGGRLRVGFLGAALASHGGTETWHATLIPRLDRDRIAVVGYGIVGGGAFDPAFAGRIAPHCAVGSGAGWCRHLARSVDVLACWGLAVGRHLPPRGAGRRPVVVAVSHGDDRTPYTRGLLDASAPDADRFAAVSGAALRAVPERRRADAAVIPNAVEPDRLVPRRSRAAVRAELGVPDGMAMILYFGRWSCEKRPQLAAAALGGVPGAYLVVAGSGAEREAVLRDSAGHADRVILAGVRPDPGDLMAAADLVVNPSSSEGFGLTVAEALWAGCPVLGTPTGLLFDRPDLAAIVPVEAGPAEWAAAIRRELAPESGARARAYRAMAEARRLYDPGRFAAAWSDFLLGLAGGPRDGGRDCAHRTRQVGCTVACAVRGSVHRSACLGCPDRVPRPARPRQ